MEPFTGQDLNEADRPRPVHVHAAAGADIRAGEFYDADVAGQFLFAPVGHVGQFIGGRIPYIDGRIEPDPLIYGIFDL